MLLVIMLPGLKWLLEYWKLLALLCGSNFRVKTLERGEAFGAADAANRTDGRTCGVAKVPATASNDCIQKLEDGKLQTAENTGKPGGKQIYVFNTVWRLPITENEKKRRKAVKQAFPTLSLRKTTTLQNSGKRTL